MPADLDLESQRTTASSEGRLRHVEVAAARTQALAALIAVIFAIPGLWFAYKTWNSQQEVTQQQIAITQRDDGRYSRRYASRVSWWIEQDDNGDEGHVLHVVNLSPVALTNFMILGWISTAMSKSIDHEVVYRPEYNNSIGYDIRVALYLPSIRPCSTWSLDIRKLTQVNSIYFEDTNGVWDKTDAWQAVQVGGAIGWGGQKGRGMSGTLWETRADADNQVTETVYNLIWYSDFDDVKLISADASECSEGS